MSHSPMDLDSSLDDLIKKRKTFGSDKNKFKKQNNNTNKNKKQHQNQPQSRPSLQTNKAKVTKPAQRKSSGINARLSTAGGNAASSGPLFTAKNTPTQQRQTPKADPSQIIITKAIPASSSVQSRLGNGIAGNDKKVKSVIASRLGAPPRQQQPQPHQQQQQQQHHHQRQSQIAPQLTTQTQNDPIQIRGMFQSGYTEQGQGISIRGRSNTATARPGLSIRGESGPTTVLMTGLDAYANSDDVRLTVENFGNVLNCEVLRDRQGRSFGEAEIEFSTKDAALDCIAQMDNRLADGRILRIILREPKKPQTYAQKQIRSMIEPSYAVSGKMYSDQLTPRYDISRK
ncbi:hypothetical protein INT46_008867 [Mucor plumbeus]|uniref:RRM domain-containing protein n=1 Tax=Mucor plumbeus TaxID=97098 RepID=A0A8H7VAH5_9FUNG|nr:hypothetical protein INT46_008867 [Mucor plumbeus]